MQLITNHLPDNIFMKALLLNLALVMLILITGCSQHSRLGTKSFQASADPPINEEIFTVCEEPPTFPKGQEGLDDFIQTHLRYPVIAIKKHVEGNVYIDFIVTKEGTIQNVAPTRGIGFWADEEAVRLVRSMPKWKPGKQNGRPVNVKYSIVIPFRLSDIK